jgi:hypothetical protein
MKKISLLLGVLFFSFFIGCKNIDESVQPDTSKSKQGKTMRLQNVPEWNGSATYAMSGISGECFNYVFTDLERQDLGNREGRLAVNAISWTEGFMQGKFDIHDRPVFLSEPYRSYELMLASAVASKEGWEGGGDLSFNDRLFLGLLPMGRLAGYPCNNYSGQDEFAYYSKVTNRGWNLWYNNQQMSFEQLADLVELELQKSEFARIVNEKTFINKEEITPDPTGIYYPYTSRQFLIDAVYKDVRNQINGRFYYLTAKKRNTQFFTRLGRIFEDAVARSLEMPNNNVSPQRKFSTNYGNVVPDMIGLSGVRKEVLNSNGNSTYNYFWWEEGVFFDAKAIFKPQDDEGFDDIEEDEGVAKYKVPFTNQSAGYIDFLSNNNNAKFTTSSVLKFFNIGVPIVRKATTNGQAILSYITHEGATIDDTILRQAGSQNVAVYQHTVQYQEGTKKLRVTAPVIKNAQYIANGRIADVTPYQGVPVDINWNIW